MNIQISVATTRQHDYNSKMIQDIFETLGFKEDETKTYLALLDSGSQTAGNLSKIMGIPRPTLYGYLEKLVASGLVSQSTQRGVKIFSSEPAEKIRQIYARKIDELKAKQASLNAIIPELEKRAGVSFFKPKMQFFEGQSGIQTLLEDSFKYKNTSTFSIWPLEEMIDVISMDFFDYLHRKRIANNNTVETIWSNITSEEKFQKYRFAGSDPKYLRKIRIAPKDVSFTVGVWVYVNKVLFISSKAESFGFMIESEEVARLQKTQHDILWNISKPFENSPLGANSFFEDIEEIH